MMWNQNISAKINGISQSILGKNCPELYTEWIGMLTIYPSCGLGTNGSETRARQIPNKEKKTNCCRNMN